MKPFLRRLALTSAVLAGLSCSPFVLAQGAKTADIQQRFVKLYPEFPVQSVTATPLAGIYELVLGEQGSYQVVYTDAQVGYLFTGDMIDLKSKQSLTETRMSELNRVDVKQLPLRNALREVRGNGQRQLIVFSDPDCPYCKQLEKELTKVNNVTVYTFLYPLAGLHPNAERKSRQIWCSNDQVGVWHAQMRDGKAPSGSDKCVNPVADNVALGQKLGFSGTPTLIFADGSVVPGALSAGDIEAKLKGGQK